jgi:WD40 repeat protein
VITQLLVLLPKPGQHCCEHLLSILQDCCFSDSAPLLATALVNGQVLLHRYQQETAEPTTAAGTTSHHQQHTSRQQNECSTSYYSAAEVLNRRSKKGASCRAIAFVSADNAHLACGFETGTLLQLDAATGQVVTRLPKAHPAGVSRLLKVSQHPSLFAAGDDSGGLHIWDVRSGQSVYSYKKHTDFITGQQLAEGLEQQAPVSELN